MMEDFETTNARQWDQDTAYSESVVDSSVVGSPPAPAVAATFNTSAARVAPGNNVPNGIPRPTPVPNVIGTQRFPQNPIGRGRGNQGQQNGGYASRGGYVNARGGQGYAPRGVHGAIPLRGGPGNTSRGAHVSTSRGGAGNQGHGKTSPAASVEIITSRSQVPGSGPRPESQHPSQRSPSRTVPHRLDNATAGEKNFAKPAKLITTRRADDVEIKATKESYTQSYLKPPVESEDYPVVGYYMWPTRDTSPSDLLGARLNALDPVRLRYHVHIEDVTTEGCLKISCPAFHTQPEHWLARAMEGVRAAIKATLAKEVAARPLYIVVPPNAETLKSLVVANNLKETSIPRPKPLPDKKIWKAKDIGFAGDDLSEAEKQLWKTSGSNEFGLSNIDKIQERLSSGLMALAIDKRSMRMRVHFGRIVFTKTESRFREGKLNFKGFIEMLDKGLESEFVKDMRDTSAALELRNTVIRFDNDFRPFGGSARTLDEVPFKEVAVIIVESHDGQRFRIEADLDKVPGEEEFDPPMYQVGLVKHFKHDKSNLRMQVEVIDFEKKIDYSLNVVSDDEIREENKNLNAVTQNLLGYKRSQFDIQPDKLGLPIPKIFPRLAAGLNIVSVSVQSTVQYMLTNSNYVVEIAIDRNWSTENTSLDPEMFARISMFSPSWDDAMVSYEDNPRERGWLPDLSDFFNEPKDDASRIQNFVRDVEYVKGLLFEARRLSREKEAATVKSSAPGDEPEGVNAPAAINRRASVGAPASSVDEPAPVNNRVQTSNSAQLDASAPVYRPAPVNLLHISTLIDGEEDIYSADG